MTNRTSPNKGNGGSSSNPETTSSQAGELQGEGPGIVGACPDGEGETWIDVAPPQAYPRTDRMYRGAACEKLGNRTGKMACPGIWKPEERYQACLHSISSRSTEVDESCQVEGKKRGAIEVTEGAGVVKVSRPATDEAGRGEGGERGPITHFSKKAARRLQLRVAKIRKEQRPVFVTLTYPDVYPWSGKGIKRHIKNLGERFKREFSQWSFFWKLELKERKSGTMEGELMPHFHLLVWTDSTGEVPYSVYETAKRWFEENWHEVVRGSLSEKEWSVLQSVAEYERGDGVDLLGDHAEVSTRTERIRSRRGVLSYTSEYLANPEKGAEKMEGIGRFWGYVNKDKLPFGRTHVLPLNHEGACKLMRAIMRAEEQDYEGLPTARSHISPDATPWYRWARELSAEIPFGERPRTGPTGAESNTLAGLFREHPSLAVDARNNPVADP